MQLISTPIRPKVNSIQNRLPESLVCFSHLRWDFVFQRPQHLLTRLAKLTNVFYLEEPVFTEIKTPHYVYTSRGDQITIVTPHLPLELNKFVSLQIQNQLFDEFMKARVSTEYGFWFIRRWLWNSAGVINLS